MNISNVIGEVDWKLLTKDRDKWWAVVNTVMNI
jgi:hypothetical protein